MAANQTPNSSSSISTPPFSSSSESSLRSRSDIRRLHVLEATTSIEETRHSLVTITEQKSGIVSSAAGNSGKTGPRSMPVSPVTMKDSPRETIASGVGLRQLNASPSTLSGLNGSSKSKAKDDSENDAKRSRTTSIALTHRIITQQRTLYSLRLGIVVVVCFVFAVFIFNIFTFHGQDSAPKESKVADKLSSHSTSRGLSSRVLGYAHTMVGSVQRWMPSLKQSHLESSVSALSTSVEAEFDNTNDIEQEYAKAQETPPAHKRPLLFLALSNMTKTMLLSRLEQTDFLELAQRQREYSAMFQEWNNLVTPEQLEKPSTMWNAELRSFHEYMLKFESVLYPWLHDGVKSALALKRSYKGRGIVMSASDKYLDFVKVALYNIRRQHKIFWPIEIFYAGKEDLSEENMRRLIVFDHRIRFRDLTVLLNSSTYDAQGFATKAIATLLSSFEEVMLIDSDVVFLQSPEGGFHDPGYKDTGALFFYDRQVSDWTHVIGDKYVQWLNNIMPKPLSKGVVTSRMFTQRTYFEQEAGVVFINKRKRFLGLLSTTHMNSKVPREKVTYKMTYGDKESFWIGFESMGEPYSFLGQNAGSAGTYMEKHFLIKRTTPVPKLFQTERVLRKVVCGNLFHTDREGRAWWWNGALVNKYADGEPYVRMDGYMLEGAISDWPEQGPDWCVAGGNFTEFSPEHKKIIEDLTSFDKEVRGRIPIGEAKSTEALQSILAKRPDFKHFDVVKSKKKGQMPTKLAAPRHRVVQVKDTPYSVSSASTNIRVATIVPGAQDQKRKPEAPATEKKEATRTVNAPPALEKAPEQHTPSAPVPVAVAARRKPLPAWQGNSAPPPGDILAEAEDGEEEAEEEAVAAVQTVVASNAPDDKAGSDSEPKNEAPAARIPPVLKPTAQQEEQQQQPPPRKPPPPPVPTSGTVRLPPRPAAAKQAPAPASRPAPKK